MMVSRVVVVAIAVHANVISANDATALNDVDVQLVTQKSAADDFESIDSSSSPCTDTPGWTDSFGNTCEWFEQKDKPGCPAYGALRSVDEHCCYCKSNSTKSTSESEAEDSAFPTLVPSAAPSGNSMEIQVPTLTPTLSKSTEHLLEDLIYPKSPATAQPIPADYPTLLAETPSLYPSGVHSDAPTKQFLPGQMLLSNKELGIELSSGLEAKLIASTGNKLKLLDGKESSLSFHSRLDGAGVIDLGSRGYVYVSNSEETAGGVYGLYFNLAGDILDYNSLLSSTRRNCGGGLTPWNSWISCEEWKRGQCWQISADPTSPNYLRAQKTMIGGRKGGRFESVASDNRTSESPVFFVTEDSKFGAMRRFQANSTGWNSLHADGDLSYLRIIDDKNFEWTKNLTAARESAYSHYQNSEGISFHNGRLYFTAKSTQKLFVLDLESFSYQLETAGLNFEGGGSFNASPDQVVKGIKRFLYFTESGGKTPGVYARDSRTGTYMTIFEASDNRYLDDETVGIAFSPDRHKMYAGYQESGVLIELRRIDNLPFP